MPLALWAFQGEYSVNIPAVLAAVVLSTLPILVLYIVGRRQLLARADRRIRQVAGWMSKLDGRLTDSPMRAGASANAP